jgi:hypothetical protein
LCVFIPYLEVTIIIYPTISNHGGDGAEHLEDPNLKDVHHLAETIQVCNLNVGDLASDQGLSKEQVVEVVELVEKELLRHPADQIRFRIYK